MNCHFVTRSLTKEWEISGGSLCYYNYTEKAVKRGYAKSLFAEEDTNSRAIEDLINELIERPLLALKPQLTEGGATAISDWKSYRALFLYFMVQASRFSKAKLDDRAETPEEHKLDQLLKREISFLDGLVTTDMEGSQIVTLFMPAGQILFFPESGFFQIPLVDKACITGFTFGFAVPITPFVALARVPKTIDLDQLFKNRGHLSGYSVGLNEKTNRVLIPKLVRDQKNDQEIIQMMEEQRTAVIGIISGTQQIRQLVVQMYEKSGLAVGPARRGNETEEGTP